MRRTAILAMLMLAGCANQRRDYPSLARRGVEGGSFDEPSRPAVPLAADPALDARIAGWSATLATITAAFDMALPPAERRAAAAHGRAAGSDAWVDAQQALAALDDERARLAALATETDAAASARAAALQPAYPALAAFADRIAAELARERATLDRLQGDLAPA